MDASKDILKVCTGVNLPMEPWSSCVFVEIDGGCLHIDIMALLMLQVGVLAKVSCSDTTLTHIGVQPCTVL